MLEVEIHKSFGGAGKSRKLKKLHKANNSGTPKIGAPKTGALKTGEEKTGEQGVGEQDAQLGTSPAKRKERNDSNFQAKDSFSLDISFKAESETLGLLGESGCGKSLTMRCIAGIETPDYGKIVVNDTVFFDCAQGAKPHINLTPQQRKTALLFQNYMLFPNLTVEDNVAAGIDKSVSKEERANTIEKELMRFGLTGFNKRYPAQLSGGQQQRVALARMLAAKPEILMLDEPFSALDSHLKGVLEQNLVSLFDAFEGTILYVSHDIDEALRFCDRIAVVDTGRIMEMSAGDELVQNPQSLAAIKLSGCKNSPEVVATGDHEVFVPDWGVHLHVCANVDKDVRAIGARSFHIEKVAAPGGETHTAGVGENAGAAAPSGAEATATGVGDNAGERENANKGENAGAADGESATTTTTTTAASNKRDNIFRVRVDRVSDSRFERTALLQFLDREELRGSCGDEHSPDCECDEFEYINKHLYWRCDKLNVRPEDLPKEGETLWVRIDPEYLHVVNK